MVHPWQVSGLSQVYIEANKDKQPFALTHTCTVHLKFPNLRHVHVFGLLQEAREPIDNQQKYTENCESAKASLGRASIKTEDLKLPQGLS